MYNYIVMEQSKKIFITNIIIFLLFAILTFFIGLHHEPWADEAQAWLIARDCTIYIRYYGSEY